MKQDDDHRNTQGKQAMRQEVDTHAISSLSLLTRPTPALCLPSERASTAARGPKANIATEDLVVNTVFNHIQVS